MFVIDMRKQTTLAPDGAQHMSDAELAMSLLDQKYLLALHNSDGSGYWVVPYGFGAYSVMTGTGGDILGSVYWENQDAALAQFELHVQYEQGLDSNAYISEGFHSAE